jgi:hypothetical protein
MYSLRRDEAREAFRQLKKNGFRCAALVQKTADGKIRKWDPFIWHRIVGMTLGAILFGGFTGIAAMVFPGAQLPTVGTLSGMTSILIGGLIGSLLGMIWIRRSKYGVDYVLLKDQARWLISEETVLVIQATSHLRSLFCIRNASGAERCEAPGFFSPRPRSRNMPDALPKAIW